jgi:RHS repeat-associated protein
VIGASAAVAQTVRPVLSNIEAPYGAIQNTVQLAGRSWGPGAVAYGPVGTPLVVTGANLGTGGTVQFISYKNGAVNALVLPVQATVTLWASNMLILTIPPGAVTGVVSVTVNGTTSNGLPFVVTPGSYSASCPAMPPKNQLQITSSALHNGRVGEAYSATLNATGGTTSYSWSVASGTLPAGLSLNSSTGSISGTPTIATGFDPMPITFQVADSASPRQSDQTEITLTVEPQALTSGTIYSYSAGYDNAGNVNSFADFTYNGGTGIMGSWGYNYDSLNRLATANAMWPDSTKQYLCWSYDSFGNRGQQSVGTAAFSGGGPNSCSTSGTLLSNIVSSFASNNRVQSTNARGTTWQPDYDAAGNIKNEGANQYLYDADGRICAVQSQTVLGYTAMTGYLYDTSGARVAKGTITSMSCDPTSNGFQFSENYVLGPGGEELTMLDGSNNWERTNIFTAGKLVGTYDLVPDPQNASAQIPALHFHLQDLLGTRRMQISGMYANLGQPETDSQSLPFGDQLSSFPDQFASTTANDATPLHFTSKERDQESGNDYFGARYYASSMGLFISPDPKGASGHTYDPQTWNRYVYAGNSPLKFIDPDGLEKLLIVYVDQPSAKTRSMRVGAMNFGHAFVGLADTDHPNSQVFRGFYPKNKWDLISDQTASVTGKVKDDKGHDWNINKSFHITDDQFLKLIDEINNAAKAPQDYNILTFNCVDWVLWLANSIGIDIQTVKGKDAEGNSADDPGDLGEDLRNSGGTQDNSPSSPSSESSGSSGWNSSRNSRGQQAIQEELQRQCNLGNRAACN